MDAGEATGGLWLVATPIGNLSDISARALEVLAQCDRIACEDTRQTGKLLKHYGLSVPLLAYHDHNEQVLAEKLADEIAQGARIGLVSDAGTPAISDPGFRLVRACQRRGLPVTSVPGPCALITALAASGIPPHPFYFAGFLAPKSSARIRFLNEHGHAPHTLVLYESCHRIAKFAQEIHDQLGPERTVCLAREITKRFETFYAGKIVDILPRMQGINLKGEFVVMIAPNGFSL